MEGRRERFQKFLKVFATILGIGLVYGLFYMKTGWGIPCPFHLVTGLDCPGCGVSRMCLALMRLDFLEAFSHNPALMILSPIWLVTFLFWLHSYIRDGRREQAQWQKWVTIVSIAVLLVFGVLRNTQFYRGLF